MNNNPVNIFQQFLSMGPNPQMIQQALFQQNPQMQVIYNQMMQSGLPPIQFVMQYAKQNNINPDMINNMYNQMRGMIPQQTRY
jgi:hypothetical protein